MEIIRIIVIVIICIIEQNDIIFGQDQISGQPDLTMYIDYARRRVTCVAGSNSTESALTILSLQLSNLYDIEGIKYIYPIKMPEFGCNFEAGFCKNWRSDGFEIIQSGLNNFSPITDERWNFFHRFGINYSINSRNFHLSFSVQSNRDVHFLLCDVYLEQLPKTRKCYWITIDAFIKQDYRETTLRKCANGLPESFFPHDTNCTILSKQETLNKQLFTEAEWRHFTIIRENGSKLKLFQLDVPIPLFEYDDLSPLNISYWSGVRKINKRWKIHDYQFLTVTKPNVHHQLGPIMKVSNTNELCISLYVALCPRCTIIIKIKSDNGVSTMAEVKGKNGTMMPWQNIRLRTNSDPTQIYSLHVYASNDRNELHPFWAIDEIRQCHANEIRIIYSYIASSKLEDIICQSLKYRHWIINIPTNNTKKNDEKLQCADPLYTGPLCNIKCSSIFGKHHCQSQAMCRLATRSEQICTCSSGFMGSTCNSCKPGMYGYNCKTKCGYCKNATTCDSITGNCANGCSEGYEPPKCKYKNIRNLQLDSKSPHTLLLTWNPPLGNNEAIEQYIVSYQRTKYMNCIEATSDNTLYKTVNASDHLRVMLDNLTPYSRYKVTVLATTISNGTENMRYSVTKATVKARDEELPVVLNVLPHTHLITVSWELPLCSDIEGPLLYQFTIKCLNDADCPTQNEIHKIVDSSERTTPIMNLIPNTQYLIEVRATRPNSTWFTIKSVSETFQTDSEITSILNHNALYALLLFIIPIIAWFTYRKFHKNRPHYTTPDVSLVQTEIKEEDNAEESAINVQDSSTVSMESYENKRISYHKYDELIDLQCATNPISVPRKLNSESTSFDETSTVIKVNQFNNYVRKTVKNDALKQQFEVFIKGRTKPCHHGQLPNNNFKNQFNNIIPYDFNRVVLQQVNNDIYSDYINASFIDGYQKENAYIATQNPRSSAFSDFWRMVLQYDINYIISISDPDQDKLDVTFWPEMGNNIHFGPIKITNMNTKSNSHYIYRQLEMSTGTVIKNIGQFQFTSWTRQGTPLYPQSLVSFMRKIIDLPISNAPMVVHCNTGIGRTGCFILMDMCIRMALKTDTINIVESLHNLRKQRINMVNSLVLYKVSHLILTEYFDWNCACLPCNSDFLSTIQTIQTEDYLKVQYRHLSLIAWRDEFLSGTKIPKYNAHNFYKNRIEHILPGQNAIKLSIYPDDQFSDYINAIPVDGLKTENKFIVTQFPLPETVTDFWRMVYEKSIKLIIVLNTIPVDDKTCIDFIPRNTNKQKYESFFIKLVHTGVYEHFDDIELTLMYKNNQRDLTNRSIHLIEIKVWPSDQEIPSYERSVIKIWEFMQNMSLNFNSPVVVTCLDGVTASGLFVASSFVFEQMTVEQECDVLLAVRVIRKNRKQFITSLVQYDFLYKLAALYNKMTADYSHYETPIVCKRKPSI